MIDMRKSIVFICIVFLSVFVSCSGKVKEVTFAPDMVTVLKNPLNGWVMYLARNWDGDFWETQGYDHIMTSEGTEVRVSDYAGTAYIRTSWSSLEPEKGKYAWRDPSSRVYRLFKSVTDRGMRLAFRIVVDCRDQGQNTPIYVIEEGAEHFVSGKQGHKTPYPQDPVFRKYYEKLVEALAEDFNDPAKTDFVDAYGLGKWGEGHNVVYEPIGTITELSERYKEDTMKWITKLYADCFTKVPLAINYHRHIGHPVSEGRDANPNSARMLQIAIDNGYCLRSDAIGMNNQDWGYNNWDRAFAEEWAYRLPVIMEGGWIVGQHNWKTDPAGYRTRGDVRKGEFDTSMETKVNMMDFRAGEETKSWFGDAFHLVRRFVAEGGYRLYPDAVSVPTSVREGAKVCLKHSWTNLGWGYCPNNIRQWNYRYKPAFALLDKDGNVVKTFVDTAAEPSEWIKGTYNGYKVKVRLEGVPAGKYMWAIGLVDTTMDNAIGLRMAVPAEFLTPDGWAMLSDVMVR